MVFSTHCQNDLGLSTANSLAGAMAGARQIECTINGIGERAGNASLEEVVMAINKRGCGRAACAAMMTKIAHPLWLNSFSLAYYRMQQMGGLRTGIRPVHIVATSKMVADYSGMMVQPHKVRCMQSCRCLCPSNLQPFLW